MGIRRWLVDKTVRPLVHDVVEASIDQAIKSGKSTLLGKARGALPTAKIVGLSAAGALPVGFTLGRLSKRRRRRVLYEYGQQPQDVRAYALSGLAKRIVKIRRVLGMGPKEEGLGAFRRLPGIPEAHRDVQKARAGIAWVNAQPKTGTVRDVLWQDQANRNLASAKMVLGTRMQNIKNIRTGGAKALWDQMLPSDKQAIKRGAVILGTGVGVGGAGIGYATHRRRKQ